MKRRRGKEERIVSLTALAQSGRKAGATVEFASGGRYMVLSVDKEKGVARLVRETGAEK